MQPIMESAPNRLEKWRNFAVNFAVVLMVVLAFGIVSAPSANAQDYGQIDEVSTEQSSSDEPGSNKELLNYQISYDQRLLEEWEETRSSTMVAGRIKQLVRSLGDYPEEIRAALAKVTDPANGWHGWRILSTLAMIVALGFLCEQLVTRKSFTRLYDFANRDGNTLKNKLRFIIVRVVIQLLGIAIMGISIYALSNILVEPNEYLDLLIVKSLIALIEFRLWLILLRNIFSPYRASLRPIPMEDLPARQFYAWFTLFFFIIEFGDVTLSYFTAAQMPEILVTGFLIPYTFALNLIILSLLWGHRRKISNMFLGHPPPKKEMLSMEQKAGLPKPASALKEFVIHSWPFIFTAWLLQLWMLWLYKTFLGMWEHAQFVTISWWITLAFPIVDRIFYGILSNVASIESLQSPTFNRRAERFVRVLQTGFRILLFGIAVFMVTKAVGANTDSLLQNSWLQILLKKGISFTIIATIAYVIWELFNAIIEKKLPTEEYDAIASLEGDGGGAGASRAETLLPLIRTCVTSVLLVFLVLSSLHSLGIAITPLLAGAGVVGIAIGFGAQKLVQDILSGLFFLIDDAFRRGEYIELEGLRGTVEKISLRSMQLRHHLGAVQTVPYGEIKTVSNLSRDWITMKLELRLSYETDIEAVRKIIKKVGQKMLEHPEYGQHFILPLKSQGVMRVEESALIIRMKFTSKPGEQWVIRREAYRQVRDALSAADIHFAHREVRVLLPNSNEETDTPKPEGGGQLVGAAGAAATTLIASELAKQQKLDEDDDGGGDDR